MTSEQYQPFGEYSPIEGLRNAATDEVESMEVEARFKLLAYINKLVSDLLIIDNHERSLGLQDPKLFLGYYGPYEGLANAGMHERPCIVFTLEKLHSVRVKKRRGISTELLYIIIPLEEDSPSSSHVDLPLIKEVFIAEVKPKNKKPIVEYKHITERGVYDYEPLTVNAKEFSRLMKHPKLLDELSEREHDPTYAMRVFSNIFTDDYVPVAHTDLTEDERIIAFTTKYFSDSNNA